RRPAGGRAPGGGSRRACRRAARRRAHVAAVLGDDALRDEEPEPAAAVLGGEERVEYVLAVLRLDAGPGVGDLDDTPNLGPRRSWRVLTSTGPRRSDA